MNTWTQKHSYSMLLWILILSIAGSIALAESKRAQWQCKTKAKEAAQVAYNQCLSLVRDDEAENIRKEYRAKIAKLKEAYEKKLKKLGFKAKNDPKATPTNSTSETYGVLPQKSAPAAATAGDSDLASSNQANVPVPVNTQTESQFTTPDTGNSLPPEPAMEQPTIRLKEATPTPDKVDGLESEPDLTI